MRRPWGDSGNALVEFTYLAVLLMVPLVYLLLTVFQVQAAAFGTTEAARQAGRAYARADTVAQGEARATEAARLAMADQGIEDSAPPVVDCPDPDPCLTPGSRVVVTVRYRVRLSLLGGLFSKTTAPAVPVTAVHTQVVDRFQAAQ